MPPRASRYFSRDMTRPHQPLFTLRLRFAILALTAGLLAATDALAQRVANDYGPMREYTVGLEHQQKQKYAVAQHRFDRALQRRDELPSIIVENSGFYSALDALELFNPDGELLMEEFATHHPEHPKAVDAHFHLGRSYFHRKNGSRP
jgi:hypothetical protein